MNAAQTEHKVQLDQPNLNEVLLEWKGPSHPYKKQSMAYYQMVGALTFFLCVIAYLLFHDVLLVLVILSVAFLVYAISTAQPIEVSHKVMPLGFENAGRMFPWMGLESYWFEEKWGYHLVVMQTRLPFPAQVRVVISADMKEKVKAVVGKYLLYLEKPHKGWGDRIAHWISLKFPLS